MFGGTRELSPRLNLEKTPKPPSEARHKRNDILFISKNLRSKVEIVESTKMQNTSSPRYLSKIIK